MAQANRFGCANNQYIATIKPNGIICPFLQGKRRYLLADTKIIAVTKRINERAGEPALLAYVFSARRDLVAQICNLPYRRFTIGRASESSSALVLAGALQNPILRYSRLQICATVYRRFTIGRASESLSALILAGAPQNAILRYSTARRSRNQSSADFQVCCVADFQIRSPSALYRAADLEVGDTAGLETCATLNTCCFSNRLLGIWLIAK